MGVGEVGAEGGSDRFHRRSLRPEVHAEGGHDPSNPDMLYLGTSGGELSPRHHHAITGVNAFQLAHFHPASGT